MKMRMIYSGLRCYLDFGSPGFNFQYATAYWAYGYSYTIVNCYSH